MTQKRRFLALALSLVMAAGCLAGCAPQEEKPTASQQPSPTPEVSAPVATPGPAASISGTFEGNGHGMQGPITVSITVEDSKITGIDYVDYAETGNITAVAKERIPAQIVEHQSLGVDTVTGATLSSHGIINAVADAAKNAGLDVAALKANKYSEPAGPDETWEADVLVMGGGGAGLSAAITAA